MSSSLNISIKSNRADVSTLVLDDSAPKEALLRVAKELRSIASGAADGNVKVSYSTSAPVQASGTITLSGVSEDDTVTIGKTTLTAKASPSGEDQFSQAGTNTQDGDSLASKINAHSVLSKLVNAVNVAGVVTVTAHQAGSIGNHIALASSNGTRLAVTGSGYLTSGAGGAENAPQSLAGGLA